MVSLTYILHFPNHKVLIKNQIMYSLNLFIKETKDLIKDLSNHLYQ